MGAYRNPVVLRGRCTDLIQRVPHLPVNVIEGTARSAAAAEPFNGVADDSASGSLERRQAEEGRNSGGSRKLRDHSLAFRFEMSLTGGIAGNFPARLYPRRISFTFLEPTDGARAKKG
jgi:hypothetical protein